MTALRENNATPLSRPASDGGPDVAVDPQGEVVASMADFPEFAPAGADKASGSLNHLFEVSVSVTAELGRVTMTVGDILKLGIGSVVGLNRGVSEPVDLLVQGVPFARGEVVVVDRTLAIRIREILDPKLAVKR